MHALCRFTYVFAGMSGVLDGFPNAAAHAARLKERPAYQQVFQPDDAER